MKDNEKESIKSFELENMFTDKELSKTKEYHFSIISKGLLKNEFHIGNKKIDNCQIAINISIETMFSLFILSLCIYKSL